MKKLADTDPAAIIDVKNNGLRFHAFIKYPGGDNVKPFRVHLPRRGGDL